MPVVVPSPAAQADAGREVLPGVAILDLLAKLLLAFFLVRVAIDPAWGNLEGKSPNTRAVVYPCLGLVVPVVHLLWRRPQFPWAADLLVTLAGFSDTLGNRLDLYDRVAWFDDWIHFLNTGLIAGAGLLLAQHTASLVRLLEGAVALGVTVSLAWEIWEYFAFMTRSVEHTTAYGDTLGDLGLGWAGAVSAGLVVAAARRQARVT